MRNKKKAIFNTIFLILIFSITVYMVFKGEDLGEIIHTVRQADPVYLLVSVVCVVLFILGESVIIFYMMRTLGPLTIAQMNLLLHLPSYETKCNKKCNKTKERTFCTCFKINSNTKKLFRQDSFFKF